MYGFHYIHILYVNKKTKNLSTGDSRFADRNELRRFARNFVIERFDSLQKDVMHCMQQPFAPFPAILYCISIIDLLWALCAGQIANKDPNTGKKIPIDTTTNSKSYMRNYIGYTQQQSDLIIEIFRHKLVHSAQPRPIFSYNNKIVTWQYHHENTSNLMNLIGEYFYRRLNFMC